MCHGHHFLKFLVEMCDSHYFGHQMWIRTRQGIWVWRHLLAMPGRSCRQILFTGVANWNKYTQKYIQNSADYKSTSYILLMQMIDQIGDTIATPTCCPAIGWACCRYVWTCVLTISISSLTSLEQYFMSLVHVACLTISKKECCLLDLFSGKTR
jgi:hypothetical protein